jgi:hypothetical protein
LFLLFVAAHNDDFRELSAQALFGAAVVFGYCLCCATCAAVAVVVFAVAWRYWGGWLLLPLSGALLGAVGSLGIAIALVEWLDLLPTRAGVHGGGELFAVLILGGAALTAAVGAVLGGIGGALLAVSLGLRRRAMRRTVARVTASANET